MRSSREKPDMTQSEAYVAGWRACMAGVDGRYSPEGVDRETGYAWTHGFLDANRREILAALDYIEAVMRLRGWTGETK